MHNNEDDMYLLTAKQLASSLMRIYCAANGISKTDQMDIMARASLLHFHDSSQAEIAWNDVQAVQKFNELKGDDLPVPMTATEGYNKHYHTSEFDGGYISGLGPHDHRDVNSGGYAFACYHPGSSLPQAHWGI